MSNKLSFQNITGTEQAQKGVVSLPIRPNQPTQYGDPGLSAKQLQQRFDALAGLIAGRYNALTEGLNGKSATRYLSLPEDIAIADVEEATVFDLLHRLVNAQGVLKSIDPETSDEAELSEIIYNIWADLEDALAFLQLDKQIDLLGNPISIVDKYATIASLNAEKGAREQADGAIHTRIDTEVLAKDTGEIDKRISAHNTSTSNHTDIRNDIADITKSGGTIDSRISAHNTDGATHQDIRTSVDDISKTDGTIDTRISAHNAAEGTHEDIREAISDIIEEDDGTIDSRISAHNEGTTTHEDIRRQLGNKLDKSAIVVNESDLESATEGQVPSATLFYSLKTVIDEFFGAPDTDDQLDRLSEIVKFIKDNGEILDKIKENKVDKTAIVKSVDDSSSDSQIPSAKLLYDNYIPKEQIVTGALSSSSTDDQVPSAKRIYSSYFLKSNISSSASTSKSKVFSAKYASETFATKSELSNYAEVGALDNLATKGELTAFATKSDLDPLIDGNALSSALEPYLKSKDAEKTYTTAGDVRNIIAQSSGGVIADTSIVKSTDELASATNDQVPSAKLLYDTYITKADAEKFTTEPEVKSVILDRMVQNPEAYDSNIAKDNAPTTYTVSMNVLHNRFVTKAQLDKKLEDYVPNIDIPQLPEVVTSLDDPSTGKVLSAATGGLIKDKIQSSLNGYATKEYVNQAVEDIDISQNLDTILAPYVTEQELKDAISTVDVNIPSDLLGKLEFIFGGGGSYGLKYRLYADHAECLGLGIPADELKTTDVRIAETISGKPVTSIAEQAFLNCDTITSVYIPSGIIHIGNSAFEGCTALKSIQYNAIAAEDLSANENRVFYDAGTSESVSALRVTIGKNVTRVPGYLFYSYNPYTYDFANNVFKEDISHVPKIRTVKFEDGSICQEIGESAFETCLYLTSLKFPDSLRKLGSRALRLCKDLVSVELQNGLKTIGSNAFSSCGKLSFINLPETITDIGSFAFSNCSAISSLEIPEYTNSIGFAALSGCSSLVSITIPFVGDSIKSYNPFGYIFDDADYDGAIAVEQRYYDAQYDEDLSKVFYLPEALKSVTITRSLGYKWAFDNCSSIERISIGQRVEMLGQETFYNCTGIQQIYYDAAYSFNDNNAFANSGSHNGVTVTIGKNVQYIPDRMFYTPEGSTAPKITSVSFEEDSSCGVIGDRAFYGASALTYIELPESLTAIYPYAFSASGISSIIMPNVWFLGESAFENCEHLNSIDLPDKITYISNAVFKGCSSLGSINIPNGVTSIGAYAFSGCTALKDVYIPSSVDTFNESAFENCNIARVHITDIVTWCNALFADVYSNPLSNGAALYLNNSYVSSLHIPNELIDYTWQITDIGHYAFYGCSSIATVTMDNGIESISNSVFEKCTNLKSIVIPITVMRIEQNAFKDCERLNSVYYGGSYSNNESGGSSGFAPVRWEDIFIGTGNDYLVNSYRYYYSENLPQNEGNYWHYVDGIPTVWSTSNSVGLLYSMQDDGTYAVAGRGSCEDEFIKIPSTYLNKAVTSINSGAFVADKKLTLLAIPNSVISVGTRAFATCSNLQAVTIRNGVEYIGSEAFSRCSSLTGVTLPDSVTEVSDRAFMECTSIVGVTIGRGMKTIGEFAFENCINISSVQFNATKMDDLNRFDDIFKSAGTDTTFKLTVAKNVTKIPDRLFADATSLRKLEFEAGSTCERIGEYAFSGCFLLDGVVIPDGVTSIGYQAFQGCTRLAKIIIPDSVTFIAASAFSDCEKITSIVIPNSVTAINDGVLYNCSSLVSITIPNSVTLFSYSALLRCVNLENINFNGTISEWNDIEKASNWNEDTGSYTIYCTDGTITKDGTEVYYSVGLTYALNKDNASYYVAKNGTCKDSIVRIPPVYQGLPVTGIGQLAFDTDCDHITKIIIPDSIEFTGVNSFRGCHNIEYNEYGNAYYLGNESNPYLVLFKAVSQEITSCEINENTRIIYYAAFNMCVSLTSMSFPDSVRYIGSQQFTGDENTLRTVAFGIGIAEIGEYAFSRCPLENVYYAGTAEQWEKVQIDDGNQALWKANIYYNS